MEKLDYAESICSKSPSGLISENVGNLLDTETIEIYFSSCNTGRMTDEKSFFKLKFYLKRQICFVELSLCKFQFFYKNV